MGFGRGKGFTTKPGQVSEKQLEIPVPDIEVTVEEDHSGGGVTISEELTVPVPTIGVTVEVV